MTDPTDLFGQGRLNDRIDDRELLAEIGLNEAEIEWRKDFLNFGEEDVQRLESFAPEFETHSDEIAEGFYDHLTSYEETQAVIDRSPKDLESLKRTQIAYLLTLVGGEYDSEYFRNRARIGKLHELLDMPVKQYVGQYNVYYQLLLGLVTDRIHDRIAETVETEIDRQAGGSSETEDPAELTRRLSADVEEGIDELHSLLKILNLDMQVAVDTYLQSRINDVELERDRFAALFENVPTPVVVVRITDDGMRVEKVNAAFEKLFGYTANDLADRNFEQYLAPPEEDPRPIDDRRIIENVEMKSESQLSEAEVTLETKFGRREFIRVAAPVDRADTDNLEYAFYIDVTDQKQRQERLKVLSRVLRHDLRNKLTVVKGCASTFTDPPVDEKCERMVDRIIDSADELIEMSDEIRKVEDLIAGDADRQTMDMTGLAGDALETVEAEYHDCEFTLTSEGETWVAATEALELAVKEAIENAAEHNDAPEPSVSVTVTESLDGRYVVTRVADNGPGISPEEYEVLMGDRERSQITHTSGLGLWIINWIVTKAGGSLHFSANAPRGSIVKLRLPAAEPSGDSTSKHGD